VCNDENTMTFARFSLVGLTLVSLSTAASLSAENRDSLAEFADAPSRDFDFEAGIVPHGVDDDEHGDLFKVGENVMRVKRHSCRATRIGCARSGGTRARRTKITSTVVVHLCSD